MTELEEIVERLLYEEEGAALDFKRAQYPFTGKTAEVKSELLKDILAFANSWRRSDAYILLGVKEVRGGRSQIVGVANHLEDADLQQFVNSKTQRPVAFSYSAVTCESKDVGVIHIPIQERPCFLRADYGRLSRHAVYVRRGSSTDQALPDEVAKMGQEQFAAISPAPELCLALASSRYEAPEGRAADFTVTLVNAPRPEDLPDYRSSDHPFADFEKVNHSYYRELARYVPAVERARAFHLIVDNVGRAVAHDVRVEIEADLGTGILLFDSSDLPTYPRTGYSMIRDLPRAATDLTRDVWVTRRGQRASAVADFGKIQAGAKVWTSERLFVGAVRAGRFVVACKVFCDELPQPIEAELSFDITVASEEADLRRLEDIANKRALQSDEWREYEESTEDER